MLILYGANQTYIDVTEYISETDNVYLPPSDVSRSMLFKNKDPVPGVLKHLLINDKIYETGISLIVNRLKNTVKIDSSIRSLDAIHQSLRLQHGSFQEEYPEQCMSVKYIQPHNCVLEIGANIGRNTLVIASLLSDSSNLVTLETDPGIANQLLDNKVGNKMSFHIENAAISARKLIQKGWETIPSDVLLPGYMEVKTVSFDYIQQKYNKVFDTIVADCEGALYYIFQDFPGMLSNIHTIIMENDYHDLSHKVKVDEILVANGFQRVYFQGGGWGPCVDYFFEVWKKNE